MKYILPLVALLGLTAALIALGLSTRQSDEPATAPASKSTSPPTGEASPAAPAETPPASAESQELLREMAAAYRAAPALNDTLTYDYTMPTGRKQVEYRIALGEGTDAKIYVPPGWEVTVLDEFLYVTTVDVPNRYVKVPLNGDPVEAYKSISNQRPLPMHFAMRWTDDIEEYMFPLAAPLRSPRIGAVGGETTLPSGHTVQELFIDGDNGRASLFIDTDTKLMRRLKLDYTGNDGADYSVDLALDPEVVEEPSSWLAFEPGDRIMVDHTDELMQKLEGELVPPFRVRTVAGDPVSREDMLGSVVVLDFWATWCAPCKQALPELEKFHQWTVESGYPVKVYGVNVYEKFPEPDQNISVAVRYWEQNQFTMPLLLDHDESMVGGFGFVSIPTTVVVAPDGTIAKIHKGYDPKMVETLKEDVRELLR